MRTQLPKLSVVVGVIIAVIVLCPRPVKAQAQVIKYRIFMIGGSSTECRVLDDSAAITAILQKRLNEAVASELSIRLITQENPVMPVLIILPC